MKNKNYFKIASTPNPLLIAHRGLNKYFLENTKNAFLIACKCKHFFGVECDVQFTSDNKAIIFHDKDLKRLAEKNILVRDMKYKDFIKTQLFVKKDNDITNICHPCTIRSYVKLCRKYKKICVIEIKYKSTEQQLDVLIKQLKTLKYLQKCIFISFSASTLCYIRKKLPNHTLHYLIKNPVKKKLNFCIKNNFTLSPYYKLVNQELVNKYNKYGLNVATWTVNNPKDYYTLKDMGVKYITTDNPMKFI